MLEKPKLKINCSNIGVNDLNWENYQILNVIFLKIKLLFIFSSQCTFLMLSYLYDLYFLVNVYF